MPMSLPRELGLAPHDLSVVDVGAADLGEPALFQPLVADGWARLFAFEPDERKLDGLRTSLPPGSVILPFALGDGGEHTLHLAPGGMTSLLEHDPDSYGFYSVFAGGGALPTGQVRLPTRRLDDVSEIERADLLKIDIQGAELMVLQHAREKLKTASVLQIEVPFVPLYKEQPLFADIDAELRAQGFMVHGLASLTRLAVSPLRGRGHNQLVDLDMIFMRDLRRPDRLDDVTLRSTAVIMDDCYGSVDVGMRCLVELERRGSCSAGLPRAYVHDLNGRSRKAAVHQTPRPRPVTPPDESRTSP